MLIRFPVEVTWYMSEDERRGVYNFIGNIIGL